MWTGVRTVELAVGKHMVTDGFTVLMEQAGCKAKLSFVVVPAVTLTDLVLDLYPLADAVNETFPAGTLFRENAPLEVVVALASLYRTVAPDSATVVSSFVTCPETVRLDDGET